MTTPAERSTYETQLIINADDFGLTDGVDQGIIRAWSHGVVTSTSVIINADGAVARVTARRKEHPTLPMGLHLNITTGRPVMPPSQIPTLVDSAGRFFSRRMILARLNRISLVELHAELRSQAELLLSTGVQFDHLDYHHHMLARYAPFFEVVLKVASEYSVPIRQPHITRLIFQKRTLFLALRSVRAKIHRFSSHPVLSVRLFHQKMPSTVRQNMDTIQARGLGVPDHLVADFFGHPTTDYLITLLERLPAGVVELMVHPALVDDGLRRLAPVNPDLRERELAVLLDPSIRSVMRTNQIELTDFSTVFLRCH